MTDADRLRAAAGMVKVSAVIGTLEGHSDVGFWLATAALLRAVADNHDNGTDRLSTTVTAAEALADVILGGAK